ncbi:MAG: 5-deoxy-glucuronate isomerase, partial [Clostridium sp.]
RTVFDKSNSPDSNLVVGEVIDHPGKWSSYPPHYHPQPEIYFYKFNPENGYGFSELGEDAVKLRQNDTVKILDNATHPQITAPGYAMYYLWVIRHLDGNPYITPTFVPEHLWVTEPDAKIWPDRAYSKK